jgi:hypothetical protein
LRYDRTFGRSTRNDGRYTAEQTDPILQPLLVAAKQRPPLPAVYELMAHVCSIRVEPPSAEQLEALAQGEKLFPQNSLLSNHPNERDANKAASFPFLKDFKLRPPSLD